MGRNLARNLARHGHTVALHNRTFARTEKLVAEHGDEGTFVPSESLEDFVASLEQPRAVIIMVKAGEPTDAVIDELRPAARRGRHRRSTAATPTTPTPAAARPSCASTACTSSAAASPAARRARCNGPSIMPGGSAESYEKLGPIFESIAAVVDDQPCCVHVGPDGAGHFVKMVHNGIEYADMQLIAEAYDLLRQGLGASPARSPRSSARGTRATSSRS